MFYLFILLSDTISIELITTHHHIALIMGAKKQGRRRVFPISTYHTTLSSNRGKKRITQSKAFLSDEHLWPAMGLPRPHNVTKVNNALCHFILELMMLLFVGQLHFFCFIAYAHFFSFQSHPLQASSHHAPSCMQLASSSIRLL